MEKKIIEVTPDGHQTILPGKEPLKKEPKDKKKKKLIDIWNNLKKALNNEESIIDLAQALKLDEEEQQPSEEMPEEANSEQDGAQDEMAGEEQPVDMDSMLQDDSEQPPGDVPEAEEAMVDEGQEEEPFDQEAEEQKMMETLKQNGLSDAEISYIIHGHHSPEIDETKKAKADATRAMSDIEVDAAKKQADLELEHAKAHGEHDLNHKKRMADHEYETAKNSVPDVSLDREHKKRILDLEYESMKQEKAMELDFKRKEYELKLQNMEEVAKKKLAEKPASKNLKKTGEGDEQ